MFKLHGSNVHTATTGDDGDISNLCWYGYYEWCYFRENKNKFPFNKEELGRVLGPAKGEGNEMAQWILNANGNIVPQRSHRPLKTEKVYSEQERMKQKLFDALIERRWGTSINPSITKDTEDSDNGDNEFKEYEDDDEKAMIVPKIEDTVDANGRLLNQMPAYDQILHSEVSLQTGEEMSVGKVIQRALGPNGTVAGTYDENPFLNTIIYEVEFPNGDVKEYAANIIAKNMLTQVNPDG
jgi:hypothetical protein